MVNPSRIPVNTNISQTAPIWGYCAQMGPPDHCGSGMVFSINAVESGPNNFAAFQSLAKQINGTGTSGGSATPSSSQNGATSLSISQSGLSGMALIVAVSMGLGVIFI